MGSGLLFREQLLLEGISFMMKRRIISTNPFNNHRSVFFFFITVMN